MTMPKYILGTEATVNNDQEARDLANRKCQQDDLAEAREETSVAYKQASEDLAEFKRQVVAYKAANNVKNPTNDQRNVIATVTRSVSNIQLDGPGHGVDPIDRQIAAHALALKKKRDEAMKAWNDSGKVT